MTTLQSLQSLFGLLEIDISRFNRYAFYKLELSETHKTNLENTFHRNKEKYQAALWNKLSNEAVVEQKKFLNYMAHYEKNEEWIKDKIEEHKHQFEVDYNGLWENFITKKHGELTFDGVCKMEAYLKSMNAYLKSNEQQFGDEYSSFSSSHRSLLYFENGADYVEKEIQAAERHNDITPTGNQKLEIPTQDIPDGSLDTIAPPPDSNSNKRRGSYKHNPKRERENKARGQKCEGIVFASLVKAHTPKFVEHGSNRDDSLGYDITYSCDSGKTWRYVEVKSIVANQFILSKNEFEFYKHHKREYEIFLVDENDKILKPLRNMELEDDKKFDMEPRDYTVRFRIKE